MDASVENSLGDSAESDDVPLWNETPAFSVETRPGNCVNVKLCDRDPVNIDLGVFTNVDALIDWVGLVGQSGACLLGKEFDSKLVKGVGEVMGDDEIRTWLCTRHSPCLLTPGR